MKKYVQPAGAKVVIDLKNILVYDMYEGEVWLMFVANADDGEVTEFDDPEDLPARARKMYDWAEAVQGAEAEDASRVPSWAKKILTWYLVGKFF